MPDSLQILRFPQSAKEEFVSNVQGLSKNPYKDWQDIRYAVANQFIKSLEHAAQREPGSDARRILGIIDESRGKKKLPAGILLRDFPVDAQGDLLDPPRQQHYDSDNPQDIGKNTFIAEYAMLALNTAMGMDLSINPALQAGWPYQHVTPKEGKEGTASHAGTAVFPRHSDGAHLPGERLVDWVGLHTIRNGATESILVDYNELEAALRKKLGKDFAILTEPRFTFSSSAAYDQAQVINAPIIDDKGPDKIWRIQGNRALIRPADPKDAKAQEVLSKFLDTLEQIAPTYHFPLQYGDVLFIDNIRGFVHTRSPIKVEENPDDARRHLLRTHGRFSGEVIRGMHSREVAKNL